MSQVPKLTLRPPPNVDFVHGFPGIPPGAPDRPQAAVKGAIEVRAPQGVKAKWVRVELRKVETLPGGGASNTFLDSVGPSPVTLWSASNNDEYGVLRSADFPFQIRIPESIPPSIALENRAGIKYELVASVCTKGKRGFFRRRKSNVVSELAPIIIDKHDLHSTWPVYCQPETREISQDGVTLIVDRSHTCYGPGDRVAVIATLKSDSLHTIILRGFEITLKESTIFRAGPYSTSGKKSVPQVRVAIISENKFPVNANLYGGANHRSELTCAISPNHTTTTLQAARHIDITYVLSVKALMGSGTQLTLDLPVIVSNWQRNVSYEAIKRIGPAPSLSRPPNSGSPAPPSPTQPIMRVEPLPGGRNPPPINTSQTFSGRPTQPEATSVYGRPGGNTFSGASQPNGYGSSSNIKADEFGYGVGAGYGPKSPQPQHKTTASRTSNYSEAADTMNKPGGSATTGTGRRPGSAGDKSGAGRRPGSSDKTNRFTIVNAMPKEIPEDSEREDSGSSAPRRGPSAIAGGSGAATARSQWPTAEEEKQRLFESARAKAERVQGSAARAITPPAAASRASPPPPAVTTPPSAARPTTDSSRKGPWLTAEEEKLRLFQQAQAAVKRTQGIDSSPPKSTSARAIDGAGGSNSMSRNGSYASPQSMASPKATPKFLTAEQEKAALRRYNEAKQAVDRTVNQGFSGDVGTPVAGLGGPVAYDALYPSSPSGSSSRPPAVDSADLPPPFDASSPPDAQAQLSEKVRMRRAYEAQDAAALARQNSRNQQNGGDAPPYSSPPPFSGGSSSVAGASSAIAEKEMLRRKFEAQDAAGGVGSGGSYPQPPPRQSAGRRPTPAPPVAGSSPAKILTAAQEKALLKARFDAEDNKPHVNGYTNGVTRSSPTPPAPRSTSPSVSSLSPSTPPAPPPLMPRPPVEYIKETQEEDARVSRFVIDGIGLPPLDSEEAVPPIANGLKAGNPGLSRSSSGNMLKTPGPPPPLPPKPPGEE